MRNFSADDLRELVLDIRKFKGTLCNYEKLEALLERAGTLSELQIYTNLIKIFRGSSNDEPIAESEDALLSLCKLIPDVFPLASKKFQDFLGIVETNVTNNKNDTGMADLAATNDYRDSRSKADPQEQAVEMSTVRQEIAQQDDTNDSSNIPTRVAATANPATGTTNDSNLIAEGRAELEQIIGE